MITQCIDNKGVGSYNSDDSTSPGTFAMGTGCDVTGVWLLLWLLFPCLLWLPLVLGVLRGGAPVLVGGAAVGLRWPVRMFVPVVMRLPKPSWCENAYPDLLSERVLRRMVDARRRISSPDLDLDFETFKI
jgi:hypothetical protein